MVVALEDSTLVISKCHHDGPSFKPANSSSFYGSQSIQKSLDEMKEERYRNTGRLLLLKRNAPEDTRGLTLSSSKKSRRDYEIFRDEQRKEIITQCPELMMEYNEAVFRRAARAIWDAKDDATKQVYRNKADAEKKKSGVSEEKKNTKVARSSRKKIQKRVVIRRKKKASPVVQEKRRSPWLKDCAGSKC